jgi:hypothetical protein
MALHLNLNHELEKQKAVRARDPLKLTMIGLGVVIALFALNYAWKLVSMSSLNSQLAAKTAELNALTPKEEQAAKLKVELDQKLAVSDKLVRRIEGRLYWSPLLEELMRAVPANIQLIRLGADANGDQVKRISINLEGTAAGTDPRAVAEDFRTKLAEVGKQYKKVTPPSFRGEIVVKNGETVEVDGKSLPTASFSINLQLQSGEEAPVAPPVRTPKKH